MLLVAASFSACDGGGLAAEYRDMPVPEERLASAEAQERGRELYLEHCALCHGENADGHGPRRGSLSSLPRDYTDSAWRRRTSPRQVFVAIREGVQGTAMPAWPTLGDDQIWDLVAYVLSVAEEGP